MEDRDVIKQARFYDEMINWDTRLAREIPVITEFIAPGRVLDIACSSGRHSFALEKLGFQPLGIDISEGMIGLAKEIAAESSSNANFMIIDASSKDLVHNLMGQYFDSVILLGNAVANIGNREAVIQLFRNIFILLRPGGKFFSQTVQKPLRPWYNPLRSIRGSIIQRIMVPVSDQEHNVELHVNTINPETLEYEKQVSDNKFFMYTLQEYKSMLNSVGFEVEAVYSGYEMAETAEMDGETLIWHISKPEVQLTSETLELFDKYANLGAKEIQNNVLAISQQLLAEHWYHCLRSYRFLYPRITAHPRYQEVISSSTGTEILDIGCNTGTDIRKMIVDGVNPSNIHGMDRSAIFWTLGYQLFEDKDRLQAIFHNFDITENNLAKIENREIVEGELSILANKFSLIHAGSLLHLLEEDQVELVLMRVFGMMQSGGVFFGRTVGSTVPGAIFDSLRYIHSPESLVSLFEKLGFVDAEIQLISRQGPGGERSTENTLSMAFYAKKP